MIFGASSLMFLVLSILQSRSLPTGPPGNSAALTSRHFYVSESNDLGLFREMLGAFARFSCDVSAFVQDVCDTKEGQSSRGLEPAMPGAFPSDGSA